MGSPDYKRWLKEKKRLEASHDSDDADLRADQAHEDQHKYRYYDREDGRWVEKVPMRHWTAGSWATLLLIGLYWFGFGYLLYGTGLGPKDESLKVILMMLAILPSIIAGVVTWQSLGRENRDRMRTLVRLSPLALLALFVLGALGSPRDRGGAPMAQGTAPTPSVSSPTGPDPFEPQPPPRPAMVAAAALPELALDPGLQSIETWWAERQACLRALGAARRVPSSAKPSLQDALVCARAAESYRSGIEVFAARQLHPLLERARVQDSALPGVLLALGHLTTGPEAVEVLVDLGSSRALAYEAWMLEALTQASARWPDEVRAAARSTARKEEPSLELLFATVEARTVPARADACATLARLALLEDDESISSAARARLEELAPHCSKLVAQALLEIDRLARLPPAPGQTIDFRASAHARLVAFGALRDFARVWRAAEALRARDDLRLTRDELIRGARLLAERAFEREVGLSPLVFGHPSTRALLPADAVRTSRCSPSALGLRAAPKDLELPDCVTERRVAEWIRAPLEPWRAKLDGWDLTKHRSLSADAQP